MYYLYFYFVVFLNQNSFPTLVTEIGNLTTLKELNISNTFDSQRAKNSIGGLGLTNLIKRLKLYFSEDYVYNVTKENLGKLKPSFKRDGLSTGGNSS